MSAPAVLATLHLADLYRDPRMRLATLRDWRKVRRYLEGAWPTPVPPSLVYTTQDAEMEAWFAAASNAPYVVIDTEYNAETRYLTLLGVGFPGMAQALQVEWAHVWTVRRELVAARLRVLVRRMPVVFQNALADVPVLEQACGILYKDYAHIDDTMLAHAVLWSELPHDLEFLASVYGQHPKMKHLAGVDPLRYNLGDVVDTLSAWEALRHELDEDPASRRIYEEQSLRLVPIILERHRRGIQVNVAGALYARTKLGSALGEARDLGGAYSGFPINVGSDDQLKLHLYDIEGLPVQRHKATRQPTINEDALLALRAIVGEGAHPLIEARIAYAAAQQALSHYIAPCLKALERDGRIYPNYAIHAQASGRWSITDPSAKNPMLPPGLPTQQLSDDCCAVEHSERETHRAVAPPCWALSWLLIPDEGERWIEWDWCQAEPRILAYLAGDERAIAAFEAGEDIYTVNAVDLFGVASPTESQRAFTKRQILKLSYGGHVRSATPGAREVGLDPARLAQASARFLARRPALAAYWRQLVTAVIGGPTRPGTREVRSAWGRRRRLLGEGEAAARAALNHPMQGTVSDLLNTTVVQLWQVLPFTRLVKTKHDSGTIAVAAGRVDEAMPMVKHIVERPVPIGRYTVRFPATYTLIYPDGRREAA